jgi:xanthosine utilization system XapX-like protein
MKKIFKFVLTKLIIMKINYLAVAACALVNMLLGMIWYGFFAIPWMTGNNITEETIANSGDNVMPYVLSVVSALTTGYIYSLIFRRMGVSGLQDGAMSGAAIGLIGLLGVFVQNRFAQAPTTLSWIDGGYLFILSVLYGALIGGWQKK